MTGKTRFKTGGQVSSAWRRVASHYGVTTGNLDENSLQGVATRIEALAAMLLDTDEASKRKITAIIKTLRAGEKITEKQEAETLEALEGINHNANRTAKLLEEMTEQQAEQHKESLRASKEAKEAIEEAIGEAKEGQKSRMYNVARALAAREGNDDLFDALFGDKSELQGAHPGSRTKTFISRWLGRRNLQGVFDALTVKMDDVASHSKRTADTTQHLVTTTAKNTKAVEELTAEMAESDKERHDRHTDEVQAAHAAANSRRTDPSANLQPGRLSEEFMEGLLSRQSGRGALGGIIGNIIGTVLGPVLGAALLRGGLPGVIRAVTSGGAAAAATGGLSSAAPAASTAARGFGSITAAVSGASPQAAVSAAAAPTAAGALSRGGGRVPAAAARAAGAGVRRILGPILYIVLTIPLLMDELQEVEGRFVLGEISADQHERLIKRTWVKYLAGTAGGIGGAMILGPILAVLGSFLFPGVGTIVGGFIGYVGGAMAGQAIAEEVAKRLFDLLWKDQTNPSPSQRRRRVDGAPPPIPAESTPPPTQTPQQSNRERLNSYYADFDMSYEGESDASSASSGGNVVPTQTMRTRGIPTEGRALLDMIGMREAPGGAYDRRFDGTSDGAPFNTNGPHPNIAVTIPWRTDGARSSAAGRYQFTKETWDRARRGAGVPDIMTPENQDKAAWWLAQQDYRDNTSGRDLAADLQNRNEWHRIAPALNRTWTSLDGGIEAQTGRGSVVSALRQNLDRYTDTTVPSSPSSTQPLNPGTAPLASPEDGPGFVDSEGRTVVISPPPPPSRRTPPMFVHNTNPLVNLIMGGILRH
jgi:muramidase (phage lysozyme)